MKKSEERKIILNSYLNLIEFLSKIYGSSCEVVLHEVEEDKVSIIAIKNGDISNRKVGTELSKIGSKMKELYKDIDYSANNFGRSAKGKEIKYHTFYIKDSSSELIGMLCLNFDITLQKNAKKYFDEFLGSIKNDNALINKIPSDSIKEFTIKTIEEVIEESGIPVERMTIEEKVKVLKILKEKEVFRTKGAVRIVSKHLKTSETSLYRYLKELD
jgi:predicted transcriptional regulator YheO